MHFPLSTITFPLKHCDPLFLLRELGLKHDYCALLESADAQGHIHSSCVAFGARDVITVHNGLVCGSRFIAAGTAFDALFANEHEANPVTRHQQLNMRYIGFLSYESARHFIAVDLTPDAAIPDVAFFLPEVLINIDHTKHEVALIIHEDSKEAIQAISDIILSSQSSDDRTVKKSCSPLPTLEKFESYRQTSRTEYCAMVKKVQKEILAGEVFQVVLSQEFRFKNTVRPDDVYEQLRRVNPSPYMYYFHTPERTIIGASPETLVRVDGNQILYRPIAGTRQRTGNSEHDSIMRHELLTDEKERCEHHMLLDLGRNDVGRVAEIGSVEARNTFRIEQYAHVYHLVSDIVGRLRADTTSFDVVRSVFPAGTLTGAPKVRAMEIIHRLERTPRGIYGGAIGYIDLNGNLDFAITIRTMLFQDDTISLRVGAGIVNDSIPEHEDDECLHKARSCFVALALATSSNFQL